MANKASILPLGLWTKILGWAEQMRHSGIAVNGRYFDDSGPDTWDATCTAGVVVVTRTLNTRDLLDLNRRYQYIQDQKGNLPSQSSVVSDDPEVRQRMLDAVRSADVKREEFDKDETAINAKIRMLTYEPDVFAPIDLAEIIDSGFVAVVACQQKSGTPKPVYDEMLPPATPKPVEPEVAKTPEAPANPVWDWKIDFPAPEPIDTPSRKKAKSQ